MSDFEQFLEQWKGSLCTQVSVGGLLARSPVAHKWKAPFRSLILREGVCWRTFDLLEQAHVLHKAGHTLGSRILIRGALESLATLIHLNQLTNLVLEGGLNFRDFDAKVSTLLLGSRNESTSHKSINIVTVLSHCEKKYKGISETYAALSECAHPNFEGVCFGYSEVNHEQYETNFSNRWADLWSERHEKLMSLICRMFEAEYNTEWPELFEKLERWLEENDAELETSKSEI